jgi:PadR family transcriptional regulator, regulatory protein PadR
LNWRIDNNYNMGYMAKPTNLGEFEQVVLLAILRLAEHGAYGVSIREEIAKCTKRRPTPGAIYTTLERLERKSFVTSSVGEATPMRGGKAKRYYHVSARGHAALNRALSAFQSLAKGLVVLGESSG